MKKEKNNSREERKLAKPIFLQRLYATYYSWCGDIREGKKELKDFLWPQLIIECDEFNNTSNMDRGFCCGCTCAIREDFLEEVVPHEFILDELLERFEVV